MSSSINPTSAFFLSSMQQIEQRISTAEKQMSSGLRVNVASDAPDQISSILQLRARIAGIQQTQNNLATVTPRVNAGEEAIQQAIQVLDTATSLATEAASTTTTASQRQDMVPQVQGILQQLVSLSQTAVNGQYIFGGDQSGQPTYTLNVSGDGVQQMILPGPPGQIQDANGVAFSIGLTAPQIFDDGGQATPAADNVFSAVTGLLTSLQNNDISGVQNALSNLQSASAYLNNQSSFYGAAQNNITAASNSASTTLVQLQQQLSAEQDTDVVQTATELQTALTAEQAAIQSQALFKPQSLFNYLS